MLDIRIAVPEDASAVQQIYEPYVLQTAITFENVPPSAEEMAQRIESTLVMYPWLVAEEDGEVVGYAYAGVFKGRAAYDWSAELSIYIRQDSHGAGIGRALYQELERLLALQGICNLYACIAYTEESDEYLTPGSIRFHEKLGFEMIGIFNKCASKFGRWYDMCWMEKMIGGHEGDPAAVTPFSQL